MNIEDKIANAICKILEERFDIYAHGHLEEENENESSDCV